MIKRTGKFLWWSWRLWEIGGGAGVQWYLFRKAIYPHKLSPLWLVFEIQRRIK